MSWEDTLRGMFPSQAALGTTFNAGMENIFGAAGQERTSPGSTVLGDYTWGPNDLSNMDRMGSFYNATRDNPFLAPVAAGAIPTYEGAKWVAQNVPGGRAVWNGVTDLAMKAGLPVGDFPIDETTSPASMSNVTSGLLGAGAGAMDAVLGTDIGKPIPSQHAPTGHTGVGPITPVSQPDPTNKAPWIDVNPQASTPPTVSIGTPPNSGPQQPGGVPAMGDSIATTMTPPPTNSIGTSHTSPDFNTPIPDPGNGMPAQTAQNGSTIDGTGPTGRGRDVPYNQTYENKITQFDSMNGMPYQVSPSAYYAGQADYNPSVYYDSMPMGTPDYWRGPQETSGQTRDQSGNTYNSWGNLSWQNPNAGRASNMLAGYHDYTPEATAAYNSSRKG